MGLSRSRRRSFLQYVADNNPFYLCSAASMLLACLLLSNTTTWSPIAAHKLVALIVTLNVYEALLVGLGLYLVVRGKHLRDGVTLLILEAVFLADVGFLNSELYTESLRTGLIVNAVLLAVGLVKLGVIFRVLRMPLASPAFGLAFVTMTVLLGHAGLFRVLGDRHEGRLPDVVMYAAWWGLAGLIVAYGLVARWSPAADLHGTRRGAAGGAIGHVLVSLMLASLAAHLGTSHWIYSCPFQAPDVSPTLLALAVLVAGARTGPFVSRSDLAALCVMLPVAAVFTAWAPSGRLEAALRPWAVTPLVLTATAAYLTLVYCFALRHFARYAAAGVLAATAYAFGPTWATLQGWGDRGYRTLADALAFLWARALPRTQAAWGGIALAGAFVMLAVGAAITLLRPRDEGPPEAPIPDPAEGPPASPPSPVTVPRPLADLLASDRAG